jgi:hypothetical protein
LATGRAVPLVGSKVDDRGARRYLESPGLASLEVRTTFEVLYAAPVAESLAFSALFVLRLFPCGRRIPVELPSPEPASSRFILPWRPSSSEFLRSHLLPTSFDAGSPTRVSSLFAASPECVHLCCERLPSLVASFRPQVFSTSRRFAPLSGSAGFFHPAATSRVLAVQGLLSPRSRSLSSSAASPLLLPLRALIGTDVACLVSTPRVADCRSRSAQLRGFSPREAAFSTVRVFHLAAARSPLRFSSPPGHVSPP